MVHQHVVSCLLSDGTVVAVRSGLFAVRLGRTVARVSNRISTENGGGRTTEETQQDDERGSVSHTPMSIGKLPGMHRRNIASAVVLFVPTLPRAANDFQFPV